MLSPPFLTLIRDTHKKESKKKLATPLERTSKFELKQRENAKHPQCLPAESKTTASLSSSPELPLRREVIS